MGVGVDEAGQNDPAPEIEFFGSARLSEALDLAPLAHRKNTVIANQQSAVTHEAEIAKASPTAWYGTAQGEQFRAAGDQPIGHAKRGY